MYWVSRALKGIVGNEAGESSENAHGRDELIAMHGRYGVIGYIIQASAPNIYVSLPLIRSQHEA